MQMNIKNPEVVRLAHEFAAVSGNSVTAALREALVAALARSPAPAEDDRQARVKAVLAITARWRADQPKPLPTQAELDAWMYDEHGLPR